jgi:hypothetical protein
MRGGKEAAGHEQAVHLRGHETAVGNLIAIGGLELAVGATGIIDSTTALSTCLTRKKEVSGRPRTR